ncbi:uncharacterized protein BCR38DRAFT_504505 [Pseudomassariella vexata]|uniref:Uncharacterized protein n=1 Tax=Pseudomassariella vexata TaxID=1141098 RepID=A0A1Y2DDV1_9PEZI|nr:uncharacterized protein BCR38DRAFT_504505 [Pseudomassariella vexata]ORY56855.1 hypothetical protein BCR38DRAFT_504505 [Pseudomassariella vexata]
MSSSGLEQETSAVAKKVASPASMDTIAAYINGQATSSMVANFPVEMIWRVSENMDRTSALNLDLACGTGNFNMVKQCFQIGGEHLVNDYFDQEKLSQSVRGFRKADVEITPLIIAIDNGQTDMVNYLLDKGADVNKGCPEMTVGVDNKEEPRDERYLPFYHLILAIGAHILSKKDGCHLMDRFIENPSFDIDSPVMFEEKGKGTTALSLSVRWFANVNSRLPFWVIEKLLKAGASVRKSSWNSPYNFLNPMEDIIMAIQMFAIDDPSLSSTKLLKLFDRFLPLYPLDQPLSPATDYILPHLLRFNGYGPIFVTVVQKLVAAGVDVHTISIQRGRTPLQHIAYTLQWSPIASCRPIARQLAACLFAAGATH